MKRWDDRLFAVDAPSSLRRILSRIWHERLLPWWRDYRWPVIAALWMLSLALGCEGIWRYNQMYPPVRPQTASDIFYQGLQLFTLNWYGPGPIPWELQIARFLSPLLAAYTAMEALALFFFDQFQLLRARRIRDHVVICGLGNKGLLLAKAFRQKKVQVLVIEQNADNDLIHACREQNILVFLGDASKPDVLRKARVHTARYLISVCGDDSVNAEVAAHARELVAAQSGARLTCATHIVNPDLWYLLRKWEVAATDAFRLQFFNVFDIGARAMLDAYPPFPEADAPPLRPPHLLIIGAGNLGQSLIVHAARRWRSRHRTSAKQEERLCVTLVDNNSEAVRDLLHLQHPELEHVCDIGTHALEIGSAGFQRAAFLADAQKHCPVGVVYVCIDNDALGLSAALALLHRIRHPEVQIIVRMAQNVGLATLLGRVGMDGGGFQSLHAFGLLDQACQPDLVLGGTNEMLARAIHEQYVRDQQRSGENSQTNPALVPWEKLTEALKESNRRQADHVGTKLKAIGCDIAPLTDWDAAFFALTPQEEDLMAKLEHERWVEERRHQGWTLGPRDLDKKTNPNLVPWEDLPEEGKAFNRASVREIPASLAQAGFQIYRMSEA